MTSRGSGRQAAVPPAGPLANAALPVQEAPSGLLPPRRWVMPRRSL